MLQPLEESVYRVISANGAESPEMTETELLKYARHTPMSPDVKILNCATQTTVSARNLPLLKDLWATTMPISEPTRQAQVTPTAPPKKRSYIVGLVLFVAMMIVVGAVAVPAFRKASESREAAKQAELHEAAKQAVDAAGAMVSVTESGLSYPDYGRRLADSKIVVDRFTKGTSSSPKVQSELIEAMDAFEVAHDLWQMQAEAEPRTLEDGGFLRLNNPGVAQIVEKYKMQEACVDGKYLALKLALSHLWHDASNSVDEARKNL